MSTDGQLQAKKRKLIAELDRSLDNFASELAAENETLKNEIKKLQDTLRQTESKLKSEQMSLANSRVETDKIRSQLKVESDAKANFAKELAFMKNSMPPWLREAAETEARKTKSVPISGKVSRDGVLEAGDVPKTGRVAVNSPKTGGLPIIGGEGETNTFTVSKQKMQFEMANQIFLSGPEGKKTQQQPDQQGGSQHEQFKTSHFFQILAPGPKLCLQFGLLGPEQQQLFSPDINRNFASEKEEPNQQRDFYFPCGLIKMILALKPNEQQELLVILKRNIFLATALVRQVERSLLKQC